MSKTWRTLAEQDRHMKFIHKGMAILTNLHCSGDLSHEDGQPLRRRNPIRLEIYPFLNISLRDRIALEFKLLNCDLLAGNIEL